LIRNYHSNFNRMRTLTLLVATLLIATSLAQFKLCPQGCFNCVMVNGKPACKSCFKSFLYNEKCYAYGDSEITGCTAFDQGLECRFCKVDYVLKRVLNEGKCVKSSITGCVTAFFYNDVEMCTSCQNGYPSTDLTSCIQKPSLQAGLMQPTMNKNCSIGERREPNAPKTCLRCIDGFIAVSGMDKCLDRNTVGTDTTGCIQWDPSSGKCAVCENWSGYYMKLPGVCAPSTA